MVWHDCKTDLPKKNTSYIIVFENTKHLGWMQGWYSVDFNQWWDFNGEKLNEPYKWAEVDLSEVE